MRKPLAVLLLLGAILALSEGCAPIPLPHYAAYRPRRVEELLRDVLVLAVLVRTSRRLIRCFGVDHDCTSRLGDQLPA